MYVKREVPSATSAASGAGSGGLSVISAAGGFR
jgi:hypothetical protein